LIKFGDKAKISCLPHKEPFQWKPGKQLQTVPLHAALSSMQVSVLVVHGSPTNRPSEKVM
jgi:hypothetical protein